MTKRRIFGPKGKTLRVVANYLYCNRLRMRYDEYLVKGRPIASGPVEGACKNLLKGRMERSGIGWTETIAEAVFHIEKGQQRIHPPGQWSVVLK